MQLIYGVCSYLLHIYNLKEGERKIGRSAERMEEIKKGAWISEEDSKLVFMSKNMVHAI